MYRFLLILAFTGCVYGMTRAQVKKTMGVLKNQCMPKNSVTEDQIGKIEQGVFLEDRNVKCYVACIYKNLQVIKNDRLDQALISKQIDILYPPELKEPTKQAVVTCIHHHCIKVPCIVNSATSDNIYNPLGLVTYQMMKEFYRPLCLRMFEEDKFNDVCEGVFASVKCLYETNPTSFIFP